MDRARIAAALDAAEGQKRALAQAIEAAKRRESALRSALESLEKQVESDSLTADFLTRSAQALRDAAAQHAARRAQIAAQTTEMLEKKSAEFAALEKARAATDAALKKLRAEKTLLSREYKTLQSRAQAAQTECGKAQTAYEQMKQAVEHIAKIAAEAQQHAPLAPDAFAAAQSATSRKETAASTEKSK
jgi:chromosome segregation ATPase